MHTAFGVISIIIFFLKPALNKTDVAHSAMNSEVFSTVKKIAFKGPYSEISILGRINKNSWLFILKQV